MMKTKYFFDTEFLEGTQTVYQWGLKTDTWLRICAVGFITLGLYVFLMLSTFGSLWFFFPACIMLKISLPNTPPTIDLISIGIISEDEREYYAISKDFNLKEAWNRYDLKINKHYPMGGQYVKEYWIRNNVLKPIFYELNEKALKDKYFIENHFFSVGSKFSYSYMKDLINWYGKSNQQIKNEIITFTLDPHGINLSNYQSSYEGYISLIQKHPVTKPEFYAYYADYDWVAFCWIFGKMMDLPKPFPMYCKDLKQIMDKRANSFLHLDSDIKIVEFNGYDLGVRDVKNPTLKDYINAIKNHPDYPKQENEHNALDDAKWNLKLYKFLKEL